MKPVQRQQVYFIEGTNGTRLFAENSTGLVVGCNSRLIDEDFTPLMIYKIAAIGAAFLLSANSIRQEMTIRNDALKAPVLSYVASSMNENLDFSLRNPSSKLFLSVEPPPFDSDLTCSRDQAREWETFRAAELIDRTSYQLIAPLLEALIESCRTNGLLFDNPSNCWESDCMFNADVIGSVRRLGSGIRHSRFSWRKSN